MKLQRESCNDISVYYAIPIKLMMIDDQNSGKSGGGGGHTPLGPPIPTPLNELAINKSIKNVSSRRGKPVLDKLGGLVAFTTRNFP